MQAIAYLINQIIDLYIIVLIVTIIMSWLVGFGVINRYNNVVEAILRITSALTEPVLRPIRNVLPSFGGLDLSPIVVFLGLRALQVFLNGYVFGPAIANGL
ncbi:MAG: YggT family protein [Pseudomonadota bacterium]